MFRRAHSHGCADSSAAHRHPHDCTHADISAHCDAYRCICTDAGAHRHVLARSDGNPATHGYPHVCANAYAGTNPDRGGAREWCRAA